MADIKWIKLATGMPDDEKMKLIDAMPERDTIHYVWIRLLIQTAKTNADGEIFLSEDMPYTDKMLAILFSRPLASIKLALKTLSRLGMIEIDSNKVIRIVNWDKHQNIEGMERVREQNRKRAENHREKKKQEKKAAKSYSQESYENEVSKEEISLDETDDLGENNIKVNSDEDLNISREKETFENSNVNDASISEPTNTTTINNSPDNLQEIIIEDDKNYSNAIKKTSNISKNKSNVTVTEQNKKENKNKKKEIEKEIETKSKNNIYYINNKNSTYDEVVDKSSIFEQNKNTKNKSVAEEDINLKALELMHYHEKITGKVGGCDYVALRSAIDIYGEKWVKMAMDVGFQKNCPDINYAIGVLKNWRREGYPKDKMEVKKNEFRSYGTNNKADKNEFAGFKPKEPRKLTEAERKRIEANLI